MFFERVIQYIIDGKSVRAYIYFKSKIMKIGQVEEPNELGKENPNLTPITNVQRGSCFCALLE